MTTAEKLKMNPPNDPLPRTEWDFSTLDKQEAKVAFYYEYGRTSGEVKNEVKKMRDARTPDLPQYWPYYPREHRLFNILERLSEWEMFPETPWLTVKANTIAKINAQRAKRRSIEAKINATLPAGKTFCAGGRAGKPGDPVKAIEWMCDAKIHTPDFRPGVGPINCVWFGDHKEVWAWRERMSKTLIFPIEHEIFHPHPEFSRIEWGINWYLTDKEILWYINETLKRLRPAQFKNLAKMSEIQHGFAGAFPFRRNAALQWLGVYRRRKSAASWPNFFALYPEESNDKRNGKSILCSHVEMRRISGGRLALDESRLRAREEDWRKAKLILEWFDKGTPLKKEDFK
jgi:hypothetical protein